MTHLIRTPSDPMGFTHPIQCETGEVFLNVIQEEHDPWHTTVTSSFRAWRSPKPNLSYQKQFYVRTLDQHPNQPLSKITCIAQHAGTDQPTIAISHLKSLMDSVEETAQREGIILYEASHPDLKPYWNTRFDLDIIGPQHQRFTAGKPAYRPGETIPEPLAVAIQHELLKGDHGFQLTTDPEAPTVELARITKDSHYNWTSVDRAIEHHKNNPNPVSHLEIRVLTNHGRDMHHLYPRCITLDDKWTALATRKCPPEHIQTYWPKRTPLWKASAHTTKTSRPANTSKTRSQTQTGRPTTPFTQTTDSSQSFYQGPSAKPTR